MDKPVYWYARTDEEGAGPSFVVGRGDEEITYPCLFQHEAQAIVDALRVSKGWKGLEQHDMPDGDDPLYDDPRFIAGMVWAANKLMEKNHG